MKGNVEAIIQKITFIETDIELQKQILASIPEGREDEVRTVLEKIVGLKEKVKTLKASIKEIDPAEYERIATLEKAADKFKEISKGKTFTRVITLDHNRECTLRLADDTDLECLVMAEDEKGNWTVLTMAGETREYAAGEGSVI